jgi:hypothetical protein
MNYGECRDRALKLINQYSIAGTQIASSYNNQEDYILRVPSLINDAQLIIARGPRPIDEAVELNPASAVEVGCMYKYVLPEDLIEINPAGLRVITDTGMKLSARYTLLGSDYILVPKDLAGTIFLQYFRRPQLLAEKPLDTAPLDNIATAQEPIPYYVGAQLVIQDDAFVYASLYNSWLTKLTEIGKAPRPESHLVEDVYGMDMWGDGDV